MERDGGDDGDDFDYAVVRTNRRTGEVVEVTERDELMVALAAKLEEAPGWELRDQQLRPDTPAGPAFLPAGLRAVKIEDVRRETWVKVPEWCLFEEDGELLILDPKGTMSSLIPVQQAEDYFGRTRQWAYDTFFGTSAWVWRGGSSYIDAREAERMGHAPKCWPERRPKK
jgi:hypothetical protein